MRAYRGGLDSVPPARSRADGQGQSPPPEAKSFAALRRTKDGLFYPSWLVCDILVF